MELALVKERCHHEAAEHATMLATRSLADEQRCHEVAECTMALAAKASTNDKEVVKCTTVLAGKADKEAAVHVR